MSKSSKFRNMPDERLESYIRRVEHLLSALLAEAKDEQQRRAGLRKRRARRANRPGSC